MKQVAITGVRKVELREVELPLLGENDLRIKTHLSGISAGTEMMFYRGTHPNLEQKKWADVSEYPIFPGYELVGTVESVGEKAAEEFSVGDRVICLGGHAEACVIDAKLAAKIPDHVSDEEATLAVLATTAMHCIRRADIRYGDTVVVTGCGILGFLVMQHARNSGAHKVVVVDISDDRLDIALKTGASAVINPKKCDVVEEMKKINGGRLGDVVIEASGFPHTEDQALRLVEDQGRVVLLGWHAEGTSFSFAEFYYKEATIIASRAIGPAPAFSSPYLPWTSDKSLRWAMELIADGKLSGKYFTPVRRPAAEIAAIYDEIDRGMPQGLQTVLVW